MTATVQFYRAAPGQAFAGNWKSTDALKMILLTSSYSPNLDTNVHYSDISANEVANGNGYTTGGAALASVTVTTTAANSWGTSWAASTAYAAGALIRPATGNGYLYVCTVAGTSGTTAPTWPTTYGATVTDGGATWEMVGSSAVVLSSSAVTWPSATITASYAAIYDSTSGVSTTDPLISLVNFGASVSSTNNNYTVTPDPSLGWGALVLQ